MKLSSLIAIAAIFAATSIGWHLLSWTVAHRSTEQNEKLCFDIKGNWGPPMLQQHPRIYYASPTNRKAHRDIQPQSSDVQVDLRYEAKKKGLLRYRTYEVDYLATYEVINPTPIRQTIYLEFRLPAEDTSYDDFQLRIGDADSTERSPENGRILEAVLLEAGETRPVTIAYRSRGLDSWRYLFGENKRIRNFRLTMTTDFSEIDFPQGTGSPNEREALEVGDSQGWQFA
ncbi:MAG: hypothetical protein AAF191_09020, partial [Verrucomicrobiota bacterium]